MYMKHGPINPSPSTQRTKLPNFQLLTYVEYFDFELSAENNICILNFTKMESKLIEAIQAHPCLYDKSASIYRNKLAKEKSWTAVAATVGVNVEHCQSRWRSLRDRYVREMSGMKPKSGQAALDRIIWRHLEAMSFLQRHIAPRKTLSNVQWSGEYAGSEMEDSNATEMQLESLPTEWIIQEAEIPVPFECVGTDGDSSISTFVDSDSNCIAASTPTAKKRKTAKDEAHDRFEKLCGAVDNFISLKKEEKSRNADFLMVLDGYLLKLSDEKQDDIKIQILSLVHGASK